jgi:hypothetical protein
MIERRFERRPARRLGVRVHDHNGQLLLSSTRNITANGAFIEIGPADFPTAKVLWVDLPDPLAESGWTNITALVVHRHADGVGVMFGEPYTVLDQSVTSPAQQHAA